MNQMDPRLFVGPAVVMDVRGKGARERITVEDLRPYESRLHEGAVAIVRTGWEERYGAWVLRPSLPRPAGGAVDPRRRRKDRRHRRPERGRDRRRRGSLKATRSTTPYWAQAV